MSDLSEITSETLSQAEKLAGLTFTDSERELMLKGVIERRDDYAKLREVPLPNNVPPALQFVPQVPGTKSPVPNSPISLDHIPVPQRPFSLEDVAFWPVTYLARLLQTRQVTSVELTEMYLARLKRYDPQLQCVVTLTEERALAQAKQADEEMADGRYRGPLHGIPWGAKDLLAVKGYPTTWGAAPYQDQAIDEDAVVVQRLDEAGAVLVAKLTMGALAWGDVWFGGQTKNPWNTAQGSSGSSAGSAATTAAGLVGFAIGTETYGSIISPANRCGITGLRPTFGRVSRAGAMALSWSMDKIGPLCRSVEDCALVFAAIHGADGVDVTAVTQSFTWSPQIDITGLRIGYIQSAFDEKRDNMAADKATLDILQQMGADVIPIELPNYPVEAMGFILQAEAAAAFDELTRSNRDDLLVRQSQDAWPNVFRQSRLITAVEYIQANRIRTLVMREMADLMAVIDLYVAPSFGGDNLLLTNLTGHPAVVVPNSLSAAGVPNGSITFTGNLYDEATILAVANAYQEATDFHRGRPLLNL
ncbi:MAG: amidase [Ardenticatenaceae bacterium]|nr:amidase [Ardenticatenaceae bacterium]MCB9443115.1 amidase [Ardenticatenaceae bacterium]